jgi:Fic family protein
MFKPIFHYTDSIVNNLTFIAEAKAIITKTTLIPNWELSLRKAAILTSAHSSTAIEGNPLTFEDVTALAEGHEIKVEREDRQEVFNYFESVEKLPDYASNDPFTFEDLLEVHNIITNDVLEDNEDECIFRNLEVVVNHPVTHEAIFTPPDAAEVPRLIEKLLMWLNSPETENLNPIIVSGLTHYELFRIHPFIDGNGRTARIMAMTMLYKRGYDLKRFLILDDYYNMDISSYYEALETVNPDLPDLTLWLEYFTKGVAVSIKSVLDKVIRLSEDVKFTEKKRKIPLNDRQMKIVKKIIENGRIANRDVQEMFGLSHSTAFDELQKLLKLEVVEIKGKGRSTHYVLTK